MPINNRERLLALSLRRVADAYDSQRYGCERRDALSYLDDPEALYERRGVVNGRMVA